MFAMKVMKKTHILQQADVSLSLCIFQGTVLQFSILPKMHPVLPEGLYIHAS